MSVVLAVLGAVGVVTSVGFLAGVWVGVLVASFIVLYGAYVTSTRADHVA